MNASTNKVAKTEVLVGDPYPIIRFWEPDNSNCLWVLLDNVQQLETLRNQINAVLEAKAEKALTTTPE